MAEQSGRREEDPRSIGEFSLGEGKGNLHPASRRPKPKATDAEIGAGEETRGRKGRQLCVAGEDSWSWGKG